MNPRERRYPPHIEEQMRAGAKQCRDLRNQLGGEWRPVQQEAYREWKKTLREDDESGNK